MNDLTREWIDKADGDFRTAQREFRVRKEPNYEAVYSHSQQYAEKYLKAYLQSKHIYFPKFTSSSSYSSFAGLMMRRLNGCEIYWRA